MQEFELIADIFRKAGFAQPSAAVARSIGDDCAYLNIAPGQQLAITTDSLVEAVHFPVGADPFLLGQRALAVAVSDLAASGAEPLAFTLALSLPVASRQWLQAFSDGLAVMAKQCRISLVGGDTTKGPLNIGITALGQVPKGQGLVRSGAQAGELVFVSGPLGAAAAALRLLDGRNSLAPNWQQILLDAFWRPSPQLMLGRWLLGRAGAVLDISDGLLADSGHLARESGVRICIKQMQVPVAEAAQHCDADQALNWALSGGDDYQLVFTLAGEYRALLERDFPGAVCIGEVQAGQGVQLLDEDDQPVAYGKAGYEHFG